MLSSWKGRERERKEKKQINSSKEFNFQCMTFSLSLFILSQYLSQKQWCSTMHSKLFDLLFTIDKTIFFFYIHTTRFFLYKIPQWTESFSDYFINLYFFANIFFSSVCFVYFCIFTFGLRCVELDWKYHGLIKPTPFVNSTLHKKPFCI